jgi:phage FluMu gp28-like protein
MEEFLQQIAPIWQPHPGQREFLMAEAKTRALACGRRWGKTEACAVDVLHRILRSPPSRQLMVAPTLEQAKILFRRVCRLLDDYQRKVTKDITKFRPKNTPFPVLEFDGHVVTARSGHAPDSLRGDEADHVIVDEAAFVPEALVTEVLTPMLSTTDGHLTCISTPNGFNWFWRLFDRGERGENGIWSRRSPSSENPRVSRQFLIAKQNESSPRSFEVEYEAVFREAAGAVFTQESIDDARCYEWPTSFSGPFTIGVDWAKSRDYTSVAVLSGTNDECWLVWLERFQGSGYQEISGRVADVVRRFPGARIFQDSTGLGIVASELLRAWLPRFSITDITFTSGVKEELVCALARLLGSKLLRIQPNPVLERELASYVSSETSAGNIRYGAKGSDHDDLVTAVMLAAQHLPNAVNRSIRIAQRPPFSYA